MLSHETPEYIASRPDWVYGKIPDLTDYRKLSVDDFGEAFKLARLGQEMSSSIMPNLKGKPLLLTFTQSLIIGAAVLDRKNADKLNLDFEKYRSVLMVTPSRYGKSFLNAITCLIMAGGYGKEVNIGGATRDKAGIIQNKIVQMVPDTIHDIQDGLVVDNENEDINKRIQRLATQTSKESLMWRNGGSIKLFSTNEGNKTADVQAAGAIGIGGDFCVDGANKVLTRHGWVRLDCLADGEEVAQYTEDGKIEFVVPSRVVRRHYTGEGYNVKFPGASGSTFMIPQHRQPLLNKNGELVIREIQDVNFSDYWSVIMAGEGTGSDTITAMDRLVIACQADGCILKTGEKGNYFQFKVKKERKIRRLEMLFEELGMDIKVHQDKRGYYVCHFYMPHNCNKRLQDWFGWGVGVNKARAILEELTEWDGYVYPDGTMYYSSVVQDNVEWAQAVAMQAGYRSKVGVQHDDRKDSYRSIYRIYAKKTATRTAGHAKMEITDWDDMVYCVTVPSGMFPIMSCNLTIVTGNCVFDEIQLMSPVGFRTASRFMMEGPDTKRFCVGNPQINGHFKDLYDDPATFVIHINDITSIVEQRMTRRGFELTDIPTYSNEYRAFIEVEFPDERSGTRFFTTLPDVYDEAKFEPAYSKYYFIGIDSAYQGADGIVVTLLSLNQNGSDSWIVVEKQWDAKEKISDWGPGTTMDVALDILKVWDQYNVIAGCIDIGYGIHIYEKMIELYPDLALEPINFSSKPTESRVEREYNAKYALNKRSEMHLDMKDLCENNKLFIAPDHYEEMLREMREIGNTPEMNKVKIEPKKKIKERLGRSPDSLDSACLAVHAMVLSGALSGRSEVTDDDLMEVIE